MPGFDAAVYTTDTDVFDLANSVCRVQFGKRPCCGPNQHWRVTMGFSITNLKNSVSREYTGPYDSVVEITSESTTFVSNSYNNFKNVR